MGESVLIQFFDHESLENIVSLEKNCYREVVYLCFPGVNEPDGGERASLTEFVRRRLGITARFVSAGDESIPNICGLFEQLRGGGRCVIDLTGGTELFAAAAGFYAAGDRGKSVVLQQHDPRSGACIFRYPEAPMQDWRMELTVKEFVALNGAAVRSNIDMNGDTVPKEEIMRLWNAVRDIPRQWNRFCTLPAYTEGAYRLGEEKGVFSSGDEKVYQMVAQRLKRAGILTGEKKRRLSGRDYYLFSLDVPSRAQVLYDKGGNLLELYCALAARQAGVFGDHRVSVELDWDGLTQARGVDVCNEVDVMLTYGHIPVCVSCKNTQVENEHLYEIAALAQHYGGGYARTMIFSNADNTPAIARRARDMGIVLVDRLGERSIDQVSEFLRRQFPKGT